MNINDIKNLSKSEKTILLNKAKDAYYNTGEELLDDATYDALEKELGLENKNYVGSQSGNYDVKHAFIMGSLAKTQVKEQRDGSVNWEECAEKINSFLSKSRGTSFYETTPKLDGCSFSAEFKNVDGHAFCETVATRGNGQYGTDIKHWFNPTLKTDYWSKIDDAVAKLCEENSDDILCIRGEVLVPQSSFSQKYSDNYVNPRAFAAGMLGIKYEDANEEKLMQGSDLHFVCYDYRLYSNGKYTELSWMNPNDSTYSKLLPYLNHIGELPDKRFCQVHEYDGNFSVEELEEIYDDYDNYRQNESEYALDGIVFKPQASARRYNEDRPRPVDCIAMKFMPMINSTEIIDIEWNVKKTGEYFPKAIVKPIIMPDGKRISRASLHNYDWILKNGTGIGAKVRVSLAGDIIPFVYEVIETADTDNINLPDDTYVKTDPNSGAKHLMKSFSENEEQKNKFLSSCIVLNINTIGPAAANMLFDNLIEYYPDLDNIIQLMNDDAYNLIYETLGTAKSIKNIVDNLKKFAKHITLVDVIKSYCFKNCGNKASEVCARIISGLSYSTNSLPRESYEWALNKSSKEYYLVNKAIEDLDIELDEEDEIDPNDVTFVILTGDPSDCSKYQTKAKFMQAHPNLKETTSWKEVQILITNDLESKTGKMQKALKMGIDIKTYADFDEINEQNLFDFNSHIDSLNDSYTLF